MKPQNYRDLMEQLRVYRKDKSRYSSEERKRILSSMDEDRKRIDAEWLENLDRPLTTYEEYRIEWQLYRDNRESYSSEERKRLLGYFDEKRKSLF